MKRSMFRVSLLAILAVAATAMPAAANRVLLDRQVRAGELILFPSLDDEHIYDYVSDQPRLATDDDGRPQFSLLRYVDNVRGDGAAPREGEGGGILHALVALSVSDDQLRDARRELRRIDSQGEIRGPVIFNSGKFALVSSFTDASGELSRQVVGLGAAPILDGEKAAVSMLLTKQGAKILWESFQTPTPDVSFSFEMELEGFRSPKQALIEADFEQIYDHRAFALGVATPYLAGEIQAAFDDLRRSGAIRLTQIGEDDELESLITTAYNKVSAMMFEPLGGTGTPSVNQLGAAGAPGNGSLLDRATGMLEKRRAESRADNDAIRERNEERRTAAREAGDASSAAEGLEGQAEAAEQRAASLEQRAAQAAARAESLRRQAGELASGSSLSEDQRALVTRLADSAASGAASLATLASEARREADALREQAATARTEADRVAADPADLEPEVPMPSFAAVASFEMKRVRQSGTFRIDLNKLTTDTLSLRFDENIGDLRRLTGDERHFRQVNLDDPLFRQRAIVASLDGLNADDFGRYINFVTVQMRKVHQGGDETHDEVRIAREDLNQANNRFQLLYGWKGDRNRRDWLRYEVRTVWSFFGGHTVEEPWRTTRDSGLNLAPPYRRREVSLEADAELLQDAGVRAVTVEVFYRLGDQERSERTSFNVARDELSRRVQLMQSPEATDFAYEITWRLRGNRRVSSGRLTTNETILFIDELPEEENARTADARFGGTGS